MFEIYKQEWVIKIKIDFLNSDKIDWKSLEKIERNLNPYWIFKTIMFEKRLRINRLCAKSWNTTREIIQKIRITYHPKSQILRKTGNR